MVTDPRAGRKSAGEANGHLTVAGTIAAIGARSTPFTLSGSVQSQDS